MLALLEWFQLVCDGPLAGLSIAGLVREGGLDMRAPQGPCSPGVQELRLLRGQSLVELALNAILLLGTPPDSFSQALGHRLLRLRHEVLTRGMK